MHAYINSSSAISPQETFNDTLMSNNLRNEQVNILSCLEPDYKQYVPPIQLRRMSRILKMGLSASKICMSNSGVNTPDAVIVGTGLGCVRDLEKFLSSIKTEHEQSLSPIPFINSSHNIVAGQIALANKIKNYNITYCHRALSFESCITDALLHIHENPQQNILIGGIDEMDEKCFHVLGNSGIWRKDPTYNLSLLEDKANGTIAGEGATFFLLSGVPSETACTEIIEVKTMIGQVKTDKIFSLIKDILKKNNLSIEDIDTYILGRNGDTIFDSVYDRFETELPKGATTLYYKHLCGDYSTASAFALWIADYIIRKNEIPQVLIGKKGINSNAQNIIIYNHRENKEHAVMLVRRRKDKSI